MPPDVLGVLAYWAVLLAAAAVVAWLSIGAAIAIAIAVIGAVVLTRKAFTHHRERSHQH